MLEAWFDMLLLLVVMELALRLGTPWLADAFTPDHDLLGETRYAAYAQHLDRARTLTDPSRWHGGVPSKADVWVFGGVAPGEDGRVGEVAAALATDGVVAADFGQVGFVASQSAATFYELLRDRNLQPSRAVFVFGPFDVATPVVGEPVLGASLGTLLELEVSGLSFARALRRAPLNGRAQPPGRRPSAGSTLLLTRRLEPSGWRWYNRR